MRVAIASIAAVLLVATTSLAASSDTNYYKVTVDGTCTTMQPTDYNGMEAVVIIVGDRKVPMGVGLLNQFIDLGDYFWWLPSTPNVLPATVPTSILTPDAVKIFVAHGTCDGSVPPPPPPTTTLISPPAPAPTHVAYYCLPKKARPVEATLSQAARYLSSGKAYKPYWAPSRTAHGANLGNGHLLCGIPPGWATDGKYRNSIGKRLVAKVWMAKRAGYYREINKR